jgi:hypothetical protein
MGTTDFHKRISSDMKPVVNRPLDTQESSKDQKKKENKTGITVYSNNKKEKRGMVLRTEKLQALYVTLEKKQSFLQTNKQEKGKKRHKTKQTPKTPKRRKRTKHKSTKQNNNVGRRNKSEEKKERKKERRRDPVPSQQRQQQH